MGNQFLILIFKICIYVHKYNICITDSNSIAIMHQPNNHQVKPV